jgi:hypothetical protein
MAKEQKREKRAVRLPAEVWFEVDMRAAVNGTSSSDLIEKALRTYFNMIGKVALADLLECFGPLADNDVARAIAKLRSEEGAQALSDKFLKISERGELHP